MSKSPPEPQGRRGLFYILFLLPLIAACPNGSSNSCPDACPRGQICDANGACVPSVRPLFEESNAGAVGLDVSISNDAVYISSVDPVTDSLIVTQIDGPVERRVLQTFDGGAPLRTAIATNDDHVAVVWREGQTFIYASRALAALSSFWDFEVVTVDGGYQPTDNVDLYLEADDSAHLVFADDVGSLRILTRDPTEETWRIETIDDGGVTVAGRGCAEVRAGARRVGIDPQLRRFGDLVVSHFDDICGDLRVSRRVEGSWFTEIVDEGENLAQSAEDRVGRFSSVALDVAGNLSLSYFDETRGRLMVATEQDGRFVIEVIDDGQRVDALARTRRAIVGAFTSITISNDGTKNVIYYDASNQSLKLATRTTGNDWSLQTVDSNNIAGMNGRLTARGSANFLVFQRLIPDGQSLRSELVWREVEP